MSNLGEPGKIGGLGKVPQSFVSLGIRNAKDFVRVQAAELKMHARGGLPGIVGQEDGQEVPETRSKSFLGSEVSELFQEALVESGQHKNTFAGLLPGNGAGTNPSLRFSLVAPYKKGHPGTPVGRARHQDETMAAEFEAVEI